MSHFFLKQGVRKSKQSGIFHAGCQHSTEVFHREPLVDRIISNESFWFWRWINSRLFCLTSVENSLFPNTKLFFSQFQIWHKRKETSCLKNPLGWHLCTHMRFWNENVTFKDRTNLRKSDMLCQQMSYRCFTLSAIARLRKPPNWRENERKKVVLCSKGDICLIPLTPPSISHRIWKAITKKGEINFAMQNSSCHSHAH